MNLQIKDTVLIVLLAIMPFLGYYTAQLNNSPKQVSPVEETKECDLFPSANYKMKNGNWVQIRDATDNKVVYYRNNWGPSGLETYTADKENFCRQMK